MKNFNHDWITAGEDTGGFCDWCKNTGALKGSNGEILYPKNVQDDNLLKLYEDFRDSDVLEGGDNRTLLAFLYFVKRGNLEGKSFNPHYVDNTERDVINSRILDLEKLYNVEIVKNSEETLSIQQEIEKDRKKERIISKNPSFGIFSKDTARDIIYFGVQEKKYYIFSFHESNDKDICIYTSSGNLIWTTIDSKISKEHLHNFNELEDIAIAWRKNYGGTY